MNTLTHEYDIVVVGGGTAGPMAAIKAKERNPALRVLLLDKAHVKRSGAISMGMDGLNNAAIPGHATPEQYTREITVGFCSGHSASGVHVNERAETTVPGLYAAGDMAAVPHNYMLGAFTYGWFAGHNAAGYVAGRSLPEADAAQVAAERARVFAPLARTHGLPPAQVEYKLRRMVNDYLQPPKVTRKMEIGLQRFDAIAADIGQIRAANPHELMRAVEVLAALRDGAWQVREEAAQTLGKLKFPEAVRPLTDALEDPYWQVRLQAARALGKLADRTALVPLTVQLAHAFSNLRKEAALSLGSLRDPAALPALTAAANDADPEVRKAVRIALAQIGTPDRRP